MKPSRVALLPLVAILVALSAPARAVSESHLYLLNQSLNDVHGGPSLVSFGGSITAAGYSFAVGSSGLALSNVLTDSDYSIDLSISFSELSAYRRIVAFKSSPDSDNGFYTHSSAAAGSPGVPDAALNFYRGAGYASLYVEGASNVVVLNTPTRVTLTRSSAGMVTGYVNGVQQFSFDDANGQALFTGPGAIARFFDDENQVEDPAGIASYIRIYDTALDGAQVAALTVPVPEPETYVLMLAGLGLVGFAARRRAAASF
jgi:hypothetical protein